jgi:hypothetical protein
MNTGAVLGESDERQHLTFMLYEGTYFVGCLGLSVLDDILSYSKLSVSNSYYRYLTRKRGIYAASHPYRRHSRLTPGAGTSLSGLESAAPSH